MDGSDLTGSPTVTVSPRPLVRQPRVSRSLWCEVWVSQQRELDASFLSFI